MQIIYLIYKGKKNEGIHKVTEGFRFCRYVITFTGIFAGRLTDCRIHNKASSMF
jgi:hypothetical protein